MILRSLFLGVATLLIAAPAFAQPTTKGQCIAENSSGQDLRRAGKPMSSIEHFRVCAASSCPKALRADCTKRLDEAQHAVATLTLVVSHHASELSISIDGAPADEEKAIELEPGKHILNVTAPGHVAVSRTIVLSEGQHNEERIVLEAAPAPPPPPAPPPQRVVLQTKSEDMGNTQRTFGYAAGAVGIAGLAVGSIFGFMAKSTYDEALKTCNGLPSKCNDAGLHLREQSQNEAMVSTLSFIGGAAFFALGTALYLTAPRAPSSMRVGIRGAGIEVGGAW